MYENSAKNEEEKIEKLEQSIKEYTKETEEIKNNMKGVFIKYDVEYTDTYYNDYQYTNVNGWRLENYDLSSDGKTLNNVRLISTGIPLMMYYRYDDANNNYEYWIKDTNTLNSFKSNVLGNNYTIYNGSNDYIGLQAAAGYYNNLGKMLFEQGTSYYTKRNQGYYVQIKNKGIVYNNGTLTGNTLFLARNDASVRMLTLPEFNQKLARSNADNKEAFEDSNGMYKLSNIDTKTVLTSKKYEKGAYWLASPYPDVNDNNSICHIGYDGTVNQINSRSTGIRPIITLSSKIQLLKKTDDTGFEYYEMIDVN